MLYLDSHSGWSPHVFLSCGEHRSKRYNCHILSPQRILQWKLGVDGKTSRGEPALRVLPLYQAGMPSDHHLQISSSSLDAYHLGSYNWWPRLLIARSHHSELEYFFSMSWCLGANHQSLFRMWPCTQSSQDIHSSLTDPQGTQDGSNDHYSASWAQHNPMRLFQCLTFFGPIWSMSYRYSPRCQTSHTGRSGRWLHLYSYVF